MEKTSALILYCLPCSTAAKQVRSELQEAEQKLRDIEREIDGVQAFTELDLGPERAFAALYQQCFTLENREYEYKLCMFDRVSAWLGVVADNKCCPYPICQCVIVNLPYLRWFLSSE